MKPSTLAVIAAALLQGCASTYQLTVMPRDSGKLYGGTLGNLAAGEGPVSITIDGKTYNGTWVEAAPARTTGWVGGGMGYGHRGWGGWGWGGGTISMDTPGGGTAKALLTASDGSGLRCDFRGTGSGGGGECRDDKGKEYDVQIRLASTQPK
jgi:hypothetical protein